MDNNLDNNEVIIVNHNRERKYKNLIAFWIFGLCNNYGYVVMLTAAIDIIDNKMESTAIDETIMQRQCTTMSTGAILLADIIPSLLIKSFSPFLPYNTNIRIIVSCLTSIFSFIAVALAKSKQAVIIGVALTSFASGLGEPTFLAHSTKYDRNVVSSWSSGTGGAGIIGALSYSLLREMGFSSRNTLMLMILVPALELFTYFTILGHPNRTRNREEHDEEREPLTTSDSDSLITTRVRSLSTKDKFAYIPKLMIYFIPLSMVYFFEYFINQGLFELVVFQNISLTPSQQYRWYQVTYQIGVFISRSSVNIIHIKKTWIMAVIQCFIAIYFLTEAIYLYTPSITIVFAFIFIEGLQGGLAYVNTYYRISTEISSNYNQFAMNIVASSDSIGIVIAGFLAIPTHNWICNMPGNKIL